ncbi:hypothetical protein NB037_15395 [Rathayibacter sp. ZW T2_19]|uniref:DUF4190 domain-containing protein n=1 Tax=Rathayibacter rubneri TaxID=2950106 RepID=A0A9X2E1M5_9MICO|nr:hypothetical protein [Rathayibacter rubneri]MCM6763803.1 hypothetical protein [Rathayibacter rubneri]
MSSDEPTTRSTAASEQPTEDLGTRATAVLPDLPAEERESTLLGAEPSRQSRVEEPAAGTSRPEQLRPESPRTSYPAPYGSPSVPAYAAAPTPSTPFSLTSLILGVTSVFFGLTVVAPVAGLVFGILGLRREPTGRTLAIWGIVLNSVMLGFVALIAVFLIFAGLLVPFIAYASGDYS